MFIKIGKFLKSFIRGLKCYSHIDYNVNIENFNKYYLWLDSYKNRMIIVDQTSKINITCQVMLTEIEKKLNVIGSIIIEKKAEMAYLKLLCGYLEKKQYEFEVVSSAEKSIIKLHYGNNAESVTTLLKNVYQEVFQEDIFNVNFFIGIIKKSFIILPNFII